jgi:hypothetical protein
VAAKIVNADHVKEYLSGEFDEDEYRVTALRLGDLRDNVPDVAELYILSISEKGTSFVFGVSKAFERGFKIRNCYLCKYHAINENRITPDDDKPIFCKMYKILQTKPQCHSTQAINCTAFDPSKAAYERYLFYSYRCEEIVY